MNYGHFDDDARQYVITDPLTPRPWINYLGNRRLTAFISQCAGGLLWYREAQARRITRYHYIPAPADRPGFYVYVVDRRTGTVWNPHFAPTCTSLDAYECRHGPGLTRIAGSKDGVRVEVTYAVPPDDDVMLWRVDARNESAGRADLLIACYLEFGLLEFMREAIGWCYLKNQAGFTYDAPSRSIRYDYHVFEAPFAPRMALGCSAEVAGFECSRDVFVGPAGSLGAPAALLGGGQLSGSQIPLGGHGCAVLGVQAEPDPGEAQQFAYAFALAEDGWDEVDALLAKYSDLSAVDRGVDGVSEVWQQRLDSLQACTGDAAVDRFVNTWSPYNAAIALEVARSISTDHMGLDGLRYRDTTQDALAAASIDADFATERMRLVLGQQTRDGGGCFAFYPDNPLPTTDQPHRSDNTVWPVYTIEALIAETGRMELLEERVPFRDGGEDTVFGHLLLGLKHIYDRRGPRGLPLLYHADWNDGLALFGDERAESVMLGMQLVYACRRLAVLARRTGRDGDADWCDAAADELTAILNSGLVWDGRWYRRLLLSSGKIIGSASARQGQIYLNPQSWSVISGVGDFDGRGATAMDAAAEHLDSDCGLRILTPPFVGIPEPEDPPLGSNPGVGENGGIFCHANTWAIIAECMLGRAERAMKYYRQLLPEVVAQRVGPEHYGREPYVYVSSIVGPVSDRFGEGGISWLTGTAGWMYVAATQHVLGIRPTLDGLQVRPCLPPGMDRVRVRRRYRGCTYEIDIRNEGRPQPSLELDGRPIQGAVLPVQRGERCKAICRV